MSRYSNVIKQWWFVSNWVYQKIKPLSEVPEPAQMWKEMWSFVWAWNQLETKSTGWHKNGTYITNNSPIFLFFFWTVVFKIEIYIWSKNDCFQYSIMLYFTLWAVAHIFIDGIATHKSITFTVWLVRQNVIYKVKWHWNQQLPSTLSRCSFWLCKCFCFWQDVDMSRNIPGKVKVTAPNLQKVKRKWWETQFMKQLLNIWHTLLVNSFKKYSDELHCFKLTLLMCLDDTP